MTKKFRKLEFRQFNDGTSEPKTYRILLESVFSGRASTDELIKMWKIVSGIKETDDCVMLSEPDYALIMKKIDECPWSVTPATRNAIAEFCHYVRNLPEVEVDVVQK